MIHKAAMDYVVARLERDLVSSVGNTDDAIPGAIKIGPLQGDPDPDVARVSIEIYPNDPDQEIKGSGISITREPWEDSIYEIELGGGITWKRRFTVKVRVLLESSREDLDNANRIASTIRSRVEKSIMQMGFVGVADSNESVTMGPFAETLKGEMVQAGGPPDAYDFFIKVRFEILTTQFIVEE